MTDKELAQESEISRLKEKIEKFLTLGNEFDRMHKQVASRYVAERIFEIGHS